MRKMVHSSPAQIVRLGSMCMKLGLSIEMRMKRMSKLFADIRSRVDYLTWGEADSYYSNDITLLLEALARVASLGAK